MSLKHICTSYVSIVYVLKDLHDTPFPLECIIPAHIVCNVIVHLVNRLHTLLHATFGR